MFFGGLLGTPLVGILGQGFIWGRFLGARFWGCIMGIPGAELGVCIGAHFGGLFECTFGGILRSCFMDFHI